MDFYVVGSLGEAFALDALIKQSRPLVAHNTIPTGVVFQKVAATNQFFNGSAKEQAHLNNVELIDCHAFNDMLQKYPVCRSLLV